MKLSAINTLDAAALAIGAVNMVIVHRRGWKTGRAEHGCLRLAHNLRQKPCRDLTGTPARRWCWERAGAARAVVACSERKAAFVDIVIANRTEDKARELADGYRCRTVKWEDRGEALENINLLVNTTALGMTGKPPLDLALDRSARTGHGVRYCLCATDDAFAASGAGAG